MTPKTPAQGLIGTLPRLACLVFTVVTSLKCWRIVHQEGMLSPSPVQRLFLGEGNYLVGQGRIPNEESMVPGARHKRSATFSPSQLRWPHDLPGHLL